MKPIRRILPILFFAALTFVIVVASHQRDKLVHGQGSAYGYTVITHNPSISQNAAPIEYSVKIDNTGSTGTSFTAYKAENDARIASWVANPAAAPQIDGLPVRLTFRTTQTMANVLQLIGPMAGSVLDYRAVGEYEDEVTYMDMFGPISPAIFSGPYYEIDPSNEICTSQPSLCEPTTYTGMIDVKVVMQGGVTQLNVFKGHPDVFLADSTAIQAHAELAVSNPTIAAHITDYSFPSAEADSQFVTP